MREQTFWKHVPSRNPDECWPWNGRVLPKGYGMSGSTYAHRFAYELLVGPIPEGLVIDHLCRNPGCCNPQHMEAVTNRENILRGNGFAAEHARKTHCPQGHAFSEENTYFNESKGSRNCRACAREYQRRLRASRRSVSSHS